MATKAVKTRNPDRRSGKAWGKNHNAPARVLSPEAQARRAAKKAKRAQVIRHERGLSITMPNITWEWATETMRSRWPNTRKVRVVDTYIAMTKGNTDSADGLPLVVEPNPEAKASRKALASSRKNGK